MRDRKYVVAPAAPGYRGTALWTVTADGELGEMVATEPQDHGPGSTAVADLKHAVAVYRAACAVLAPDEATVERLADVFRDAWHAADERGEAGQRVTHGLEAVLAALAGTSAQARHTADDGTAKPVTFSPGSYGRGGDGRRS